MDTFNNTLNMLLRIGRFQSAIILLRRMITLFTRLQQVLSGFCPDRHGHLRPLGNPRLERLDTNLPPVRLGLHTPALLGEGHDPRLRLRQPAVKLTDLPRRFLALGCHLSPQPPRLAAQHDRNGQQQHYYKRKKYDNGDIHGDKG